MKKKRPIHGGDIAGFAASIGKLENQIMDYSSNINPLGPPASLEKVYQNSFPLITKYPDLYCRELHQTIAQHLSLNTNNILAGNGAIALIELAIRTLQPKNVLIVEPCFNEYKRLAQLHNAKVHSVYLKKENQFQFSLEEITSKLDNIDLVILGSPNNPTGTALNRQDLLTLIHEVEKHNSFLLIDEAFIDWHPENSVVDMIQPNSCFTVIRSLTKYFALAGIRIGYAVGTEYFIEQMQQSQESWSCNVLAQTLGITVLNDIAFQENSRQWFQEESVRCRQDLESIPVIQTFPSLANYILIKVQEDLIHGFCNAMKKAGIYLRTTQDFNGLNHSYFRIAIQTTQENQFLVKKFKECFARYDSRLSISC